MISRLRSSHDFGDDKSKSKPAPVMNWCVFAFQGLLVVGITTETARKRAKKPYCESCKRWMKREVTSLQPAQGEELVHGYDSHGVKYKSHGRPCQPYYHTGQPVRCSFREGKPQFEKSENTVRDLRDVIRKRHDFYRLESKKIILERYVFERLDRIFFVYCFREKSFGKALHQMTEGFRVDFSEVWIQIVFKLE